VKVMLVGNFAPDRQESMQRYTQLLAQGLPAAGVETLVISPQPRVSSMVSNYHYNGWKKYLGYVDKFVLFPRELQRAIHRHQPDLVHVIDQGNGAYASVPAGRPVLVTCHDLLQIRAARGEISHHHPGWMGRRFQAWILHHLNRASHFVCGSFRTRSELLRLLPRRPETAQVIHNGLHYPYAPVPRAAAETVLARLPGGARLLERDAEFYLNVGGGQWYKNRPGLFAIFAEMRRQLGSAPQLVLVGKPLSSEDRRCLHDLGVASAVHHFSNVTNAELAAFYSLARGLIFPSWEEGFGWPIAEAQACGCPVFTSNRPPMTEVGADGALYIDPARPDSAAAAIIAARPDHARWRERGLARAVHWSTARMIADYAALYARILSHHENFARH